MLPNPPRLKKPCQHAFVTGKYRTSKLCDQIEDELIQYGKIRLFHTVPGQRKIRILGLQHSDTVLADGLAEGKIRMTRHDPYSMEQKELSSKNRVPRSILPPLEHFIAILSSLCLFHICHLNETPFLLC